MMWARYASGPDLGRIPNKALAEPITVKIPPMMIPRSDQPNPPLIGSLVADPLTDAKALLAFESFLVLSFLPLSKLWPQWTQMTAAGLSDEPHAGQSLPPWMRILLGRFAALAESSLTSTGALASISARSAKE